jgi:glutathione S-transferase
MLDLAEVDYDERQHLPLFRTLVAATAGRLRVPIVRVGGRVFDHPRDLLRWLRSSTESPLDDDREAVSLGVELSGSFARAAQDLHAAIAARNDRVFRVFEAGRAPPLERWTTRWLRRGGDRSVAPSSGDRAVIEETFARVAARLQDGRRYLLGERLSFADVTFAALAAPVLLPPHHPVPHPSPRLLGADDRDMVTKLRQHPAGVFGLRVYAERPLSRASHARQVFVRTRRFFD